MELDTILESIDPTKEFTTGTSSMAIGDFKSRRFGNSETTVIRVFLKNGLIISMASGGKSFSSVEKNTFEVAVLESGKINYLLTNGEVLCHQSLDDIRELIIRISETKKLGVYLIGPGELLVLVDKLDSDYYSVRFSPDMAPKVCNRTALNKLLMGSVFLGEL